MLHLFLPTGTKRRFMDQKMSESERLKALSNLAIRFRRFSVVLSVSAAAILVASACSSGEDPSSASNGSATPTSSRTTAPTSDTTTGSTTTSESNTATPSGGGESKVVVNGETIATDSNASCAPSLNPNYANQFNIEMTGVRVTLTEDYQRVLGVTITGEAPKGWSWDSDTDGPATVTKSGDGFTITGNATPHENLNYKSPSGSGPPAPFEIDVICS